MLGLLRGNEDGWGSTLIVARARRRGRPARGLRAIERASASRCCRCGLFRNRAFTGAQIAAFAISASFFAVFLYTTLYLQQILGLSAIEAGLVYLPGTMLIFVVAGATARSARRSAAAR